MKQDNQNFIHDPADFDEIKEQISDEAPVSRNDAEAVGTPKAETNSKSFLFEMYDMLHDLVYILAAVTLLFVFVVRLVGVEGESMLPTLHNGDYLLLESNFLYRADEIEYGDIVVLNAPYHMERDGNLIVKRVIATEGQTIDIDYETSQVLVNGIALQEGYINDEIIYRLYHGDNELQLPAVVPEGHIFVLGDNRNNSSDSRFAPVGMIDERCVLGKAVMVLLPGQSKDSQGNITDARDWSRIGLVDNAE